MTFVNGATMWEWQFGRIVFQIVKPRYWGRRTWPYLKLWIAKEKK